MPRLTQREQLARIRAAIRAWKAEKHKDPRITLSTLADRTGLTPRRCEVLCTRNRLDVRRNARELREELTDDFVAAVEGFQDWCERRSENYRHALVAALQRFMKAQKG